MQFIIACHKPSTDTFFEDEVTISSAAFETPAEQAEAIRLMYSKSEPRIDVLLIKQLALIETRCF